MRLSGFVWYIIWKSRGGIMVNGVLWEVPRPKPEGPQAPRVFAVGPLEALHSHIILSASRTSKEGFLSLAANPTCAQGVHWTLNRAWTRNFASPLGAVSPPYKRKL